MRRLRKVRKLDKLACWLLIIVGGFIGTVFTLGMHYWNAPVTQQEARQVTAVYQSHEMRYGRTRKGRTASLNEIRLHLADHETLSIDSACVDAALPAALASLPDGAVLSLLIHPNSDSVLAIHHAGQELLNFDKAVRDLSVEATGFMVLGLFMYLGVVIGAYHLITGKTY